MTQTLNPIAKNFLEQPFENILGDMLGTIIQKMDWKFYMDNKPLPVSMMTGNRALLPAILWNAEKAHNHLTGRSIGVQFRSDGEASVGASASVGEVVGRSRSVFLLFCLETLCQAIENHPSSAEEILVSIEDLKNERLAGKRMPPPGSGANVDYLIQDFFEDHDRGILPWAQDSQPKSPNLSWTVHAQV